MALSVVDPANQEIVGTVVETSPTELDGAVDAARSFFLEQWRRASPREQGSLLYSLGDAVVARSEEFSRLLTRETGKPISGARREVLNTARTFAFYAGLADKLRGETIHRGADYLDFTLREPYGVTVHIVPWNFPLQLMARSCAPALAAGNVCVVKPPEEAPLTIMLFARMAYDVGLPRAAFQVLPGRGPEVGRKLCEHPGVDHISFTGSRETGSLIMAYASRNITPVSLELGGKNPIIVFADADIELASTDVVRAFTSNCGQVCSAASRLLVHNRIGDNLVHAVMDKVNRLQIGPGVKDPDIGPVISRAHLDKVLGFVRRAELAGAEVRMGGYQLTEADLHRGFFVAPTLVDRVDPKAEVAQQEIFGPVLTIHPFDSVDEALTIADSVEYGLTAGVYTRDINLALRCVRTLEVGQVYVNDYFSDTVEIPFGGYKASGIGKQKGIDAVRAYTREKSVCVRERV